MRLIQQLRQTQPLVHCITNVVVANFQANGLLAIGASPVMADAAEEAEDIAKIAACSILNIGTLKQQTVDSMILAGNSARAAGKPVVLDPVGAGATPFRKASVLKVLDEVDITLIRCNAGELAAIADVPWNAKGVDAGEGSADIESTAKQTARKYNCLVAVSGEVDIVTDGYSTLSITGGHPMMTAITGTGCLLSSVTGAFLAVGMDRPLAAVADALSFYKRAGELTAEISRGPGDFAVNFLNTLHTLDRETKTFLV
ncbi:hydroxyethylthiazole kinase [Sporosarcina sp. P37]|uniref:hydroxyethylthiazole kinase n=1 Tax=unclassified Sporosarcina TaxID=2647733 RepID=UPI000A17B61A|nr:MULTISPECIES: hydroxyethylthiazole kinase [unclassified Sporosarcina]ARK24709.1 hydroxyethylthiazole kinase [Sporosarcina sp. P37]PID19866.1 hydroxyethylthiazole kinase [Sporosarcina sp. P35]